MQRKKQENPASLQRKSADSAESALSLLRFGGGLSGTSQSAVDATGGTHYRDVTA